MALKPPLLPSVADEITTRALDAIVTKVVELQGKAIVDGSGTYGVELAAGVEAQVPHGLGRIPRGRVIVSQSTAMKPSDNAQGHTIRTWAITADIDCTASFWFF